MTDDITKHKDWQAWQGALTEQCYYGATDNEMLKVLAPLIFAAGQADAQAELTASRARISELESFKDDWHVMRDECDAAKLGFAVLLNENRDYELVITSLNARIAELKAAQQWLPIESAPVDGTRILATWNPKLYGKPSDRLTPDPIIVRWIYGHWKGAGWYDDSAGTPMHVTHWMPLPAPPETGDK